MRGSEGDELRGKIQADSRGGQERRGSRASVARPTLPVRIVVHDRTRRWGLSIGGATRFPGYDKRQVGPVDSPSSPSFAKPPLEEVALAVQFQPQAIDIMTTAQFSQAFADEFPRQEEQAARPPMTEEFPVGPRPPFRLELIATPPLPRLWFLSESGTRLIQLQSDLIAYNWRRSPEGVSVDEIYPRYTVLRAEFEKVFKALEQTVEERGRPTLKPNWCEITYINHIGPTAEGEQRPSLDELLRGVEVPPSEGFLPSPESVGLNLGFVIPGPKDPLGRLAVGLATATRTSDSVPIWVMTLTARMRIGEEGTMESALKTLDMGHNWVVSGFVELTSDQMQAAWGRTA